MHEFDLIFMLFLLFVCRFFSTVSNSLMVFDGRMLDFERVASASVQSTIIANEMRFGQTCFFGESSRVNLKKLVMTTNSSVAFADGSSSSINLIDNYGILNFSSYCSIEYSVLSSAALSHVIFQSAAGAVISQSSIIKLSGSLHASRLILLGSLVIPSLGNVLIHAPILSGSQNGCSIHVDGKLEVASEVSLQACSIFGEGRLSILNGFVAGSTISVKVKQLEIAHLFEVPSASRMFFANSSLELISCRSNISGLLLSDGLSNFSLSNDSSLIFHNANVTGFNFMKYNGNVVIQNTALDVSVALFDLASHVSCLCSKIRARNISCAGA
jgi:hypothetical protein